MNSNTDMPGHATDEELMAYWRTKSVRSARERARRLGIRRVGKGWPWLSIWRAEGIAPPARRHWEALKTPHKTIHDLPEILSCSDRTARRKRYNKPDASFPDPIEFGPKTRLWRAVQIEAWEQGRDVPVFARLPEPAPTAPCPIVVSEGPPTGAAAAPEVLQSCVATNASGDAPFGGFDPFAEVVSPRGSATNAGNRPK